MEFDGTGTFNTIPLLTTDFNGENSSPDCPFVGEIGYSQLAQAWTQPNSIKDDLAPNQER